jgi:octaprenyl-diphosphate synthase
VNAADKLGAAPFGSGDYQLLAGTEIPSSNLRNVGMKMLSDALTPAANELAELRDELLGLIPTETGSSRQVLHHIFSASGKLVRPAMFFLSCKLTGYDGEHLIPIGAVCEFVHCASLLHDDVVDNSTMRRGLRTANTVWGDQTAVLVGDLTYSRASELMAATGKIELVATFAGAIRKMSEGELIQLENVYNLSFSEETYLKLLRYKTGVLIGAACRASGILADASLEQRNALEYFGTQIGIAFQLMDDALDYVGNRELFGKPTRSDLLDGKVTMPLILLRDLASIEEYSRLSGIVAKETITEADVDYAASLVHKYRTDHLTSERAREHTDLAIARLQAAFPRTPARTHLEALAESLLLRIS